MRLLTMLAALTALAACGVDGAPERPKEKSTSGITITGTAEVGITGGSN
ncbi:MAG: argininosuccinate lyase [Rhodobacteraceae bacterium]|nr:MAG: argininosuccinate lyase [Paracoccaceae bacterium]